MPVFTATPATRTASTVLEVLVEHQPRERAVRCNTCAATTFEAQHGVCDDCISRGRLTTRCMCREGVLAAQAVAS